jgi:hypothetical protein
VLRRFTLLSVLALSGALFGVAPALASLTLQPAPINQAPLKPRTTFLKPSLEEVEFGAVDIHGNGQRQTVTFQDTFPKPFEQKIRSVEIVGKGSSSFQIVGNDCSERRFDMSPENCQVEVAFTPGALGARSATLELVTEEDEEGAGGEVLEEIEVPLSGEGITGTLSASQSPLSFAAIPYTGGSHQEGGQNETEEIKISDDTNAAANIESVSIVGPDASSYSAQWGNCEHDYLAPNNYCTMGIRFEPTSLGANEASLVITSDASNSPLTIALEGEGLHGPQISMSTRQALLGEVLIGSATWQTFTLTNTGDYPLGVQQAILVSGTPLMFPVLSDTCSEQVVKPSASCGVTVGFQPTTSGEKDASILFITSTSLPLNVVGIDGIGVQPAVAPQVGSPQSPPASPAATSLSVTLTSPAAPVVQASPPPPHRPKVAARSRCKRRKACQKQVQQMAAAERKRQLSAVRLRQREARAAARAARHRRTR